MKKYVNVDYDDLNRLETRVFGRRITRLLRGHGFWVMGIVDEKVLIEVQFDNLARYS